MTTEQQSRPTNLQGPLDHLWLIAKPLPITVEEDVSGCFVVSDSVFFVYGDGGSLAAAWHDYKVSLLEYCEMVRRDAVIEPFGQAQYQYLLQYIQPCNSGE